jgi:rsbT co-antagonist protein RsbR
LATFSKSKLAEVIGKRQNEITTAWLDQQAAKDNRIGSGARQEMARQSREFIDLLVQTLRTESSDNVESSGWTAIREFLSDISASRVRDGYSASDTAYFIFSLKPPLFDILRSELGSDPQQLAEGVMDASQLLDKLGILTTEAFQRTREEVIIRQQQELLELSTPVVRLWDNILALPLIGTLDSARTQVVMQNLLEAIVQTRSDVAIIDITGVPMVDTLVAQHLLKTVAAARLMGADCLISGIRPQIAQTIIHLGVDLTAVTTKATLADAFSVALRRTGHAVVKEDARQSAGFVNKR